MSASRHAALGLLVLLACEPAGEPGDRATMGCPVSECSDLAEGGLRFVGSGVSGVERVSGRPVRPTAVGGVQTITIQDASGCTGSRLWDARTLECREASLRTSSERPSVMAVAPEAGWRAEVLGVASGTAGLRVEDERGSLVDRVDLRVARVANVGVEILASPDFGRLSPREAPEGWAAYPGREVPVVIQLFGEGGVRLIDEGATLISLPFEPCRQWDCASITVPETTVGGLELSVQSSDGRILQATLPVDRDVTRIARNGPVAELLRPSSVGVGGSALVCFTAMSDAHAIANAPLIFEATGAIRIAPLDEGVARFLDVVVSKRCVQVEGAREGVGELAVRIGDVTRVEVWTVEARP